MNLACNRKWWPLGRGFDRFYGFLGGEVDQWTPWLAYDNHFITPPKTPEQGYHNVPDLVDKAKEFIADVKQVAPERAFCIYFAPAPVHAAHHAEGLGRALSRPVQRRLGRLPGKSPGEPVEARHLPGDRHRLSPHDPDVAAWAKLPDQEKRLYARQMEAYAAYLSFVDHQSRPACFPGGDGPAR